MAFYNKLFSAFILSLFAFTAFAQKEIPVLQFKASPLIPIYNPIVVDSTDVNKKTFETKNLLKTQVNWEEVRTAKKILKAGADSVFNLDYAPYDRQIPSRDKAVQLFSFNVDADRYCKAELSITSTDMLEVYINGKKEDKKKETKEDSLSKAKTLTFDLTLEPHRYEVIIKRLAEVKNFNESQLKAYIKPVKKDSLAQITLSTDAKRRVTINDIMEGNRITAGTLSPTGQYYLIGTKDVFPGGKSLSSLELRDLKTNQTIYRFPSAANPQWIDGKNQLVYSKTGESNMDLILLDIPSLNETAIAEGIQFDSYSVSPDAQTVFIYLNEEIPADKGDLKRVLSPSDRSGEFRNRTSLSLYSVLDKSLQQITFGRTDLRITDMSRDGQKALLFSTEEDITHRPFSVMTLFELDVKTLQLDTLFRDPFITGAYYSPDGKNLLITGGAEAFNGIGENLAEGQISNTYDNQAFIYNRKSKEIEPITKDFNPSIKGAQWASYDNNIYFRVEDKDFVHIYKYNPQSKQYALLDLPEEVIAAFSVADSQPVALFRGESPANAYRLYSYDLKTQKSALLADPYKKQLDEMAMSPVTSWTFTSSDNTIVDGRYCLPPDFDPQKKYPLIVYYYGGTSPTSRIFETTYPSQVYAALGYVVYIVEPSGATGYGQEFSARHVNAWGQTTADEIIEGTQKFYREHAFVDSTKVGCIGASYGGFMTQYLQTQTDIFAAAVSHAGISSIASYWGEGYWGYSYSGAASANSYPWNNPDLYINQSPLFKADKINTPLLLLHGTADTNVPIGESIQMYNALKILGKEVEFIQVQGENHAIYDYKKRIAWNNTIYAWFAKWLKGQPEWWEALYPER
ncbi:MAG: prolyl oligopeptidase family serine peptidase [Candidatus Symbiothrix sp.]|jgi:dipeptidyl aminopeptidase/acylaminoacyl peptidase|nr:prolyl oligopeptidase family serine peptidase [Candidatus Symbiothrix sp.]